MILSVTVAANMRRSSDTVSGLSLHQAVCEGSERKAPSLQDGGCLSSLCEVLWVKPGKYPGLN